MWPPDDYAALARVRTAGVPIAAGENAGTPVEIAQLIDVAKVDFVQPSVTKIGGVSEMQRHSSRSPTHRGPTLAPHSPYFGPGPHRHHPHLREPARAGLCGALLLRPRSKPVR